MNCAAAPRFSDVMVLCSVWLVIGTVIGWAVCIGVLGPRDVDRCVVTSADVLTLAARIERGDVVTAFECRPHRGGN